MGERYAAAHSSAQQQVQLLAARQQRSVCAYPPDGRHEQAPLWLLSAHGMRADVPPFLPQPRPPPSRSPDRSPQDATRCTQTELIPTT